MGSVVLLSGLIRFWRELVRLLEVGTCVAPSREKGWAVEGPIVDGGVAEVMVQETTLGLHKVRGGALKLPNGLESCTRGSSHRAVKSWSSGNIRRSLQGILLQGLDAFKAVKEVE